MKSTKSPNIEMGQQRQDSQESHGSCKVQYGARDIDPDPIIINYFSFCHSNGLSEAKQTIVYINFIAIRCQRRVHSDRVMGVCNKNEKIRHALLPPYLSKLVTMIIKELSSFKLHIYIIRT